MKAVVILAVVLVTSGVQAAVYRGQVWSWRIHATLIDKVVLQPTDDPSVWTGIIQCHSITKGARCIQQFSTTEVQFDSIRLNFVGETSDGCVTHGYVRPNGALNGRYDCDNGDFGGFNLRRIRR